MDPVTSKQALFLRDSKENKLGRGQLKRNPVLVFLLMQDDFQVCFRSERGAIWAHRGEGLTCLRKRIGGLPIQASSTPTAGMNVLPREIIYF